MSLYEQYKDLYDETIAQSIVKNKDKEEYSIIRPELWIAMRFLEDKKVKPWSDDFYYILKDLERENEKELLYCIMFTLDTVLGNK